VNVSAIRAFRTGFRDDFRFCRHLLMPATAIVFLLFPSGGFFTRAARPDWRNHPRKGDDISRRSDRLESRIPAILTWEDE